MLANQFLALQDDLGLGCDAAAGACCWPNKVARTATVYDPCRISLSFRLPLSQMFTVLFLLYIPVPSYILFFICSKKNKNKVLCY